MKSSVEIINPTLEKNCALVVALVRSQHTDKAGFLSPYTVYTLVNARGEEKQYALTASVFHFRSHEKKQELSWDVVESTHFAAGRSSKVHQVLKTIHEQNGRYLFNSESKMVVKATKIDSEDGSKDKENKLIHAEQNVRREVRISNTVSHLKLSDPITVDDTYYLRMNEVPGVPLTRLVNKLGASEFLHLVRTLVREIPEQIGEQYIHCDLHGGNVLVEQLDDGSWRVRVIDFEWAKALRDGSYSDGQLQGAVYNLEPGMLSGELKRIFTKDTDLYALFVAIVILAGVNYPLYENAKNITSVQRIERDWLTFNWSQALKGKDFDAVRPQLLPLLQKMVAEKREERATREEVLTTIDTIIEQMASSSKEKNRVITQHLSLTASEEARIDEAHQRFGLEEYEEPRTRTRLLARHFAVIQPVQDRIATLPAVWQKHFSQLLDAIPLQITTVDAAFWLDVAQYMDNIVFVANLRGDSLFINRLKEKMQAQASMPVEQWVNALPELVKEMNDLLAFYQQIVEVNRQLIPVNNLVRHIASVNEEFIPFIGKNVTDPNWADDAFELAVTKAIYPANIEQYFASRIAFANGLVRITHEENKINALFKAFPARELFNGVFVSNEKTIPLSVRYNLDRMRELILATGFGSFEQAEVVINKLNDLFVMTDLYDFFYHPIADIAKYKLIIEKNRNEFAAVIRELNKATKHKEFKAAIETGRVVWQRMQVEASALLNLYEFSRQSSSYPQVKDALHLLMEDGAHLLELKAMLCEKEDTNSACLVKLAQSIHTLKQHYYGDELKEMLLEHFKLYSDSPKTYKAYFIARSLCHSGGSLTETSFPGSPDARISRSLGAFGTFAAYEKPVVFDDVVTGEYVDTVPNSYNDKKEETQFEMDDLGCGSNSSPI